MPRKCPVCGEETLLEERGVFRFIPPPSVPGGTIEVRGTSWSRCSACGEAVLPPALRHALDEAALQRQGLLPASEIKSVRQRSGLSQVEIARRLGVGEKTYARWEAGRSTQNKSSDNLIRLIDQDPETFARLEARRRPDRQEIVAAYFRWIRESRTDGAANGTADGGAVVFHGIEMRVAVREELRTRLRGIVEVNS